MEEYSFSRYKKVPKTGLKKIGDTSYLNSVLQCLGNIYYLANYFLDPKNQEKINNNIKEKCLSFVIERLFIHLYPYPEKDKRLIYGNEKVLGILANYNVTYKSVKNRNPVDLINNMLDIIHNELNEKKSLTNTLNYDIYDCNSVVCEEISNFNNTHNSIISDIFCYFVRREKQCILCKKTKYELYHFNTFDLDISKCATKNENKIINIHDSLTYFSTQEKIKYFCQNCNQFCETNIISKIYSSPNIFIFLLDRGDFNENLMNIQFKLEEIIDLNNFIEIKSVPTQYELIGIVSISRNDKKYLGFSKSPIDKKWYKYNEENVDEIDFNSVLDNNNNSNLYVPCILFYDSLKNINNA